ncbi:recombinase family protein [Clostridium tyrobutyricum]|uniref:recombinase family protein n=1 Tax=Clostridium tyrobutyricum TaxID=1519 RepID=UPI001C37EED9|nr:recombinase family protein [Clostridium tyrobutyricum]MBV4424277.1 recombinase family protein [Clostridium tyrobutyricum]
MARKITVIPPQRQRQASLVEKEKKRLRVAAYCRVSTDQEEQLSSYENQIRYYKTIIEENPEYEMVDIYADEGISGTNTKKRAEFNRMIADCRNNKIDRVITKSISRFARNTLDCLNYVRELQSLGIEVIFENENINTLDGQGEVLITILASLSQNTSKQISDNSKWGIHRRYEQGQFKISTKRFLGYDNDENGKLVINKQQAKIVKRIYEEYLSGKTTDYITRILTKEGIKNWDGNTKWHTTTLQSIITNEKYMGDAILQKSFTADFLTKKKVKNEGQLQSYYVEDNHEAIIAPDMWKCTQMEIERRNKYLEEHSMQSYGRNVEMNPFSFKVVCGECNKAFTRKGWKTSYGTRQVWQCNERYRVKGKIGCTNRHVDDGTLHQAFIYAWNSIITEKEQYIDKWKKQLENENFLIIYRAKQFLKIIEKVGVISEVNLDHLLATLECIKIFENGHMVIRFLEGTEILLQGN